MPPYRPIVPAPAQPSGFDRKSAAGGLLVGVGVGALAVYGINKYKERQAEKKAAAETGGDVPRATGLLPPGTPGAAGQPSKFTERQSAAFPPNAPVFAWGGSNGAGSAVFAMPDSSGEPVATVKPGAYVGTSAGIEVYDGKFWFLQLSDGRFIEASKHAKPSGGVNGLHKSTRAVSPQTFRLLEAAASGRVKLTPAQMRAIEEEIRSLPYKPI